MIYQINYDGPLCWFDAVDSRHAQCIFDQVQTELPPVLESFYEQQVVDIVKIKPIDLTWTLLQKNNEPTRHLVQWWKWLDGATFHIQAILIKASHRYVAEM